MKNSLENLHILALDCQTTGANPGKGHLLEIGWGHVCGSSLHTSADLQPQAYLVELPSGAEIPRSIQRITGIGRQDLKAALTPGTIRQRLHAACRDVRAANHARTCPTVIHFSRFEEPFLRDLYHQQPSPDPFPLQLICTHEITKRLLPDLPRRGLRALAGYFGHAMPECRRSADHVRATAVIWKKLVGLLQREAHILTLEQLAKWMTSSLPGPRRQRAYPMDPGIRRRLSDQPGVYRMLRANGDVLYIGKAKSLKRRVNSYFRQRGSPGEHILEMLTQAYRLDTTVTASALEAALLESDEIKRRSPPYNIALRKGRRGLVFCSRDLQEFVQEPDEDHPVGPLPSGSLKASMAAFGVLIDQKSGAIPRRFEQMPFEQNAHKLLGIPSNHVPEGNCLLYGVDIFLKRHFDMLQQGRPLRVLTGIGARLRREQLQRCEPEAEETTPAAETGASQTGSRVENDRPAWEPEDVARLMESVTRRAAHLIRRSRWFCMLSEASLAWTSAHAGKHNKMMLGLKSGQVICREKTGIDRVIPVPPGYTVPVGSRKRNIDVTTYDRLRVLTTELRRLVAEGRKIELRLRPGVMLRNHELEKLLRWV